MKEKTNQKIEAAAAVKAHLAKTFGVTIQFVSLSLLFRRNSDTARAVREAALKNGCRLVKMVDITEENHHSIKVLDAKGNVTRVINE